MSNTKYPTIQSFPWQLSIEAIKTSLEFDSFDRFHSYLVDNLPINSTETRKKYANVIKRRFFPNRSLDDFAPNIWRYYQDSDLLADILRVITLESEPAVAEFVINNVLPKSPGSTVEIQEVKDFIINSYNTFKHDSYDRLKTICRNLGFLGGYNGHLIVENIPVPENAFLILLHEPLAPTPRIVRLTEVLEKKWWQYLGIRKPDDVREILRHAENAGLLARYSIVDELEQVTTRYDREKYFQNSMRI